eukprot:TRINITY_DN13382_c0_g1_i1.p1 TRINITY_DN13382_c0_g1~~TRINITY_DN13382_c0_g1_i1.p1  ORF type:complete len:418 (+),score=69.20 TRINITY_DN13382_c0_g1_i1:88-1341(+)
MDDFIVDDGEMTDGDEVGDFHSPSRTMASTDDDIDEDSSDVPGAGTDSELRPRSFQHTSRSDVHTSQSLRTFDSDEESKAITTPTPTPPPPPSVSLAAFEPTPKRNAKRKIATPDLAPTPEPRYAYNSLEARGLRLCKGLLRKLMSLKDSLWFRAPVDPVALGIPDYFDIVKNPMDLGTISKKLEADGYSTADDFAADMRLVWGNAMLYNPASTMVHMLAQKLSDRFEKEYAKTMSAPGGDEATDPATKTKSEGRAPKAAAVSGPGDKPKRKYVRKKVVEPDEDELEIVDDDDLLVMDDADDTFAEQDVPSRGQKRKSRVQASVAAPVPAIPATFDLPLHSNGATVRRVWVRSQRTRAVIPVQIPERCTLEMLREILRLSKMWEHSDKGIMNFLTNVLIANDSAVSHIATGDKLLVF